MAACDGLRHKYFRALSVGRPLALLNMWEPEVIGIKEKAKNFGRFGTWNYGFIKERCWKRGVVGSRSDWNGRGNREIW